MRNDKIDQAVTCPACGREGRLKGVLAVSRATGAWLSFVPDEIPPGFVLITNDRIRLNCTCGTTAWPTEPPPRSDSCTGDASPV